MSIDPDVLRRFPIACAVLVHPVEVVQGYIVERFGARFEALDPLVAEALLDVEMLGWYERDESPITPGVSREERCNPWGITFMTMFDMSADSDLFATRETLEEAGFELGSDGLFARGAAEHELLIEIDGQYHSVAPMLDQRGLISIHADVAANGAWTITKVIRANGSTTNQQEIKAITALVRALDGRLNAAAKLTRLKVLRGDDKTIGDGVVQRSMFGDAA